MFGFFKKKAKSLLSFKVNGSEIFNVFDNELPIEKTISLNLDANSYIELIDHKDVIHLHKLGEHSGWFHFLIRFKENLACQVDCAITQQSVFDAEAFSMGEAVGIRFQPFFLTGAEVDNQLFQGRGLFKRGLHFDDTVTSNAILLSCECDYCHQAFLIKSFHTGFSGGGYFYSGSGAYTIIVSDQIPGCPSVLTVPDAKDLQELEARLPKAPDGSEFKLNNSFRCPHCKQVYIDFKAYPEERQVEYYGNYFVGEKPILFGLS